MQIISSPSPAGVPTAALPIEPNAQLQRERARIIEENRATKVALPSDEDGMFRLIGAMRVLSDRCGRLRKQAEALRPYKTEHDSLTTEGLPQLAARFGELVKLLAKADDLALGLSDTLTAEAIDRETDAAST